MTEIICILCLVKHWALVDNSNNLKNTEIKGPEQASDVVELCPKRAAKIQLKIAMFALIIKRVCVIVHAHAGIYVCVCIP